jgi:hypothetical protein
MLRQCLEISEPPRIDRAESGVEGFDLVLKIRRRGRWSDNDATSTLRKRHHVEFLDARAKLEARLTELPDSVVGTSTTLEIQDLHMPTILNGSKGPSTPAS